MLENENKSDRAGPAICFKDGSSMSSQFWDSELRTVLSAIQETSPKLIDPSIDVKQKFSVYRSFRRGATTRAREVGVSDTDKLGKQVAISTKQWRRYSKFAHVWALYRNLSNLAIASSVFTILIKCFVSFFLYYTLTHLLYSLKLLQVVFPSSICQGFLGCQWAISCFTSYQPWTGLSSPFKYAEIPESWFYYTFPPSYLPWDIVPRSQIASWTIS